MATKYPGFDAISYRRDLRRWASESARAYPAAIDRVSHALADEIRKRCPVDTGHLKSSVKVRPIEEEAGIVTQVVEVGEDRPTDGRWYVGFVEYGAHDKPANPFIRPAIDAKEAQMIRTIEAAVPGD